MENELIRFCQDNKLNLRQAGSCISNWLASCPSGGNHAIMISTTSNEWGCGYCKKKGRLPELKQWVESKRRKGV